MKSITLLSITVVFASSVAFASGGGHHVSKTDTKHYTSKHTCSSGYKALKKELKDTLKRECITKYGSSGINILRHEKWTKIECVKKSKPGERATVTVTGKFSADCK